MKKLMMALAVVVCATAVQAANYKWRETNGQIYQAGGKSLVESGTTVYLFNSSTLSQSALIDALFVDNTYASLSAAAAAKGISVATTTTDENGTIPTTSSWAYNDVAAGSTWTAYYALVAGDNVFVSDLSGTITAPSLTTPTVIKMGDPTAASQAEAFDAVNDGWSGGGWYTAEAVPEPTSGLLLLLGMAGLSLRRRRA